MTRADTSALIEKKKSSDKIAPKDGKAAWESLEQEKGQRRC